MHVKNRTRCGARYRIGGGGNWQVPSACCGSRVGASGAHWLVSSLTHQGIIISVHLVPDGTSFPAATHAAFLPWPAGCCMPIHSRPLKMLAADLTSGLSRLDQSDYRCVYLFKCGRDNPQLINRKNRMLTLTSPYRALCATGNLFFEFHLKIKGEGPLTKISVEVFCHGLNDTPRRRYILALESHLSKMDMILASTSGNDTCKMVLYDSEVAGTKREFGSGGSVPLSRHVVAVPFGEDLLLYISVLDSYNKSRRVKFVIRNDVDKRTCNLGTYYKLHVNIIWKGVFRQSCAKWKVIGSAPFSFMSAVLAASFSTSFSYERSSFTILLQVDVLIFRFLRVAILDCRKMETQRKRRKGVGIPGLVAGKGPDEDLRRAAAVAAAAAAAVAVTRCSGVATREY
ncbi:LOW QUALITY PROTEIN: hypothetical protein U9M48_014292 [Paspalum notatum var. saurae]|uniref:DUF6598 domain-containing protein n=1 Tax=Paspalum notatum var. saurae TaxID=547442 RepID=A0AAQ3T0Y7_PASNO